MKVQDKVVVVTGGGSGIGQKLVLQLLAKGATVAAADINVAALNETKVLAGPNTRLSLHQTDISSRESVSSLARDVVEMHETVDVIINNAGIIHPFKPVTELDLSVVDRMINVNFHGVVNMTKAFLPKLLSRPVAHIVNVSSMGGLVAFPNQTLYGASKAAVKVFSEGLYAELASTNVGVTLVVPGAIRTNITKNCDAHSDRLERLSQKGGGTLPETAAARIIEGIEKNRFRVIIGADAMILGFLYRLFPLFTIRLVRRVMTFALAD